MTKTMTIRTRPWIIALFAAAAVATAGCERERERPGGGTGEREGAEQEMPAPLTRCDLDGVWTLEETPTAASGCDDDWAPFVDAYLRIRQEDEMLEINYVPEANSALRCSGLPADDACSITMTCEGRARATDVEAALRLTFEPDDDLVSGTRTLEVLSSDCRMTVSIDGRRETPEAEAEETASR